MIETEQSYGISAMIDLTNCDKSAFSINKESLKSVLISRKLIIRQNTSYIEIILLPFLKTVHKFYGYSELFTFIMTVKSLIDFDPTSLGGHGEL